MTLLTLYCLLCGRLGPHLSPRFQHGALRLGYRLIFWQIGELLAQPAHGTG